MGSNPILGKNITVAFTHIDTTMRGKYQALCMYVMYIYCLGRHFYISLENQIFLKLCFILYSSMYQNNHIQLLKKRHFIIRSFHLCCPPEGSNGVKKSNFRKSDCTTVQNFQKGPFPVNMAKIRQKIGFGPNWPHLAIEGGAKWGLKFKFSTI